MVPPWEKTKYLYPPLDFQNRNPCEFEERNPRFESYHYMYHTVTPIRQSEIQMNLSHERLPYQSDVSFRSSLSLLSHPHRQSPQKVQEFNPDVYKRQAKKSSSIFMGSLQSQKR